jgi:hypothetical protein
MSIPCHPEPFRRNVPKDPIGLCPSAVSVPFLVISSVGASRSKALRAFGTTRNLAAQAAFTPTSFLSATKKYVGVFSSQHSYRCPAGKDFSAALRSARNDKVGAFWILRFRFRSE